MIRKPPALLLGVALAAALAAAACSSADDSSGDGSGDGAGAAAGSNDPHDPNVEVLPDALAGLPKGATQLANVCARGNHDAVTRAFCTNGKSVSSLVDVQDALGLGFKDRSSKGQNGTGGNPAFALLGHSSAIVTRDVSAINPHAFVFTPPPGQPVHLPGYVVMGFARGEPFVEIAAEDPNRRKLTFYLLRFEVGCEATSACRPGDMLTPAIESGWKGFSLYDDEDLKNTIVDCRQCHQPDGAGSAMMLRMQELHDPWTHWFRNDDQHPGGLALLKDYRAAHGDTEDYAGIPGSIIQLGDGAAMEDFVIGQGFQNQPNVFDSKRIEREVQSNASQQPEVNMPKGTSPTWQQLYDAASAGQFIPPPYHDVKVTDPDKLKFATGAYQKFLGGGKAADLPDIRRVFLDDALPEMTMRPKAGATGSEVIVQMCSQCHNSRLDSSLSRARFDATNLAGMSAATKAMAVARMKLPASDIKHMPPAMFRTVPSDALDAAVAELSK